jgi:hypothetical protein
MQPFTDAVFSFFSDNMPSECLSGANWERAIIVSLARTLGELSGQLGKKEARKHGDFGVPAQDSLNN